MFLRSWSHFTVRQSQVRVHFHTPAPQLPHFFVFSLADGPVVSLPVWLLKFLSTRLEDAQSFSFCSCEYPEGCCGQHWPCLAATWATPQACWVGLAQEGGRKARAGRWGRGAVKGPAPCLLGGSGQIALRSLPRPVCSVPGVVQSAAAALPQCLWVI